MSERLRYKGRFIKKKVLVNKAKQVANMTRGRIECCEIMEVKKKNEVNCHKSVDEVCPGRRIVELGVLAKNLKCNKCENLLSLENVVKEKRIGLNSILTVHCDKCSMNTLVPTGKKHSVNDKTNSDVNIKAVLGTLRAGMGCVALNKLLACLNVPTISPTLYKRYEREIGPALELSAKESCKRAAAEERQLVIDNLKKLSKELEESIFV